MEASCSAGAWKLAGAGRAVTGFGPSRLLNGPWGWVMLSLLCSTASIGVADELAVADAEAGLEQRVNLAHWQPLFEGFDDLRRERRIGHPALAPPRVFSGPILSPPPVVPLRFIGYDLSVSAYGKQGQTSSITVILRQRTAENRGFDGDCRRMTEFAGE